MSNFRDIKNNFINEFLGNDNHKKIIYISAYQNNIEPIEISKDKDLSEFTNDELKAIIENKTERHSKIKSITEIFIEEYLKWYKIKEKEYKKTELKKTIESNINNKKSIEEENKKIELTKEINMNQYFKEKSVFISKLEDKDVKRMERKKLKEEKIKHKEFITEEKRRLKLKREIDMKEYLEQKMVFIEEFYSDAKQSTKDTYIDCYKHYVAPLEIYKNKDLVNFIDDDIQEMFTSMNTTSPNVKRMLYSFIDSYAIWTDSKGMNVTHTNPLQSLDKDELFALNMKAFRKQYFTLDETYELCERAMDYSRNEKGEIIERTRASYQDCLILLLARYGIEGKAVGEIVNLKWEDIDRNKKKIRIVVEETGELKEVDIDERLIDWIDKAQEETCYNYMRLERYYYDNGYVIKTQKEDNNGQETKNAIYNRVFMVCKLANESRISLKNLVISREFDLIDKIREIKGHVLANDIAYVHKIFYPSASYANYFSLLQKYELYRDTKVVSRAIHIDEVTMENEKREKEKKEKKELEELEKKEGKWSLG